jgi:hypothetical protein
MLRASWLAAAAILVVLLCAPATAHGWGIMSPSRNIKCGEGLRGAIVCLIEQQDFVPKRSCDGLYTVDAVISRHGRATKNVGCFGGLPFDMSNARVLGYGHSVTHRNVTCRSSAAGMRCTNVDHHGFLLRRSGLRLF